MKKLFLTALCLALAAVAIADVKVVQKVKSGSIMGQPPKDMTMTMYIKGHKMRNDTGTGKQYQLIDIDAKKVYIVEPDKKQVMVMTTEMLKQTAGMAGQMMGSKPTVEKTGTTHTYNGFKCEDVNVKVTGGQMMNFTSVSCVSTSIDIKEFEPFKEFSQDFAKIFGGDATSGIEGFPVHTDTTIAMMGQNVQSSTDVISISRDTLDASMFTIPADYTVKEMNMPAQKKP